eukprot:8021922-Alexandrium_andersonii.AAC.1
MRARAPTSLPRAPGHRREHELRRAEARARAPGREARVQAPERRVPGRLLAAGQPRDRHPHVPGPLVWRPQGAPQGA